MANPDYRPYTPPDEVVNKEEAHNPSDPREIFLSLHDLTEVHSSHLIPLLRSFADYSKNFQHDYVSIAGMLQAAGIPATQPESIRIISKVAYVGYWWDKPLPEPYGVLNADTDDLPQSIFTEALVRGVKVARHIEQQQEDPTQPVLDAVFRGIHKKNDARNAPGPKRGRPPSNQA
ncbi:MAG: hypothetical protein KBD46_03980 [Candidatus Levybacteria bacterium]|nr:hypothetical protein [Candidatus Levybacteria bacterium]